MRVDGRSVVLGGFLPRSAAKAVLGSSTSISLRSAGPIGPEARDRRMILPPCWTSRAAVVTAPARSSSVAGSTRAADAGHDQFGPRRRPEGPVAFAPTRSPGRGPSCRARRLPRAVRRHRAAARYGTASPAASSLRAIHPLAELIGVTMTVPRGVGPTLRGTLGGCLGAQAREYDAPRSRIPQIPSNPSRPTGTTTSASVKIDPDRPGAPASCWPGMPVEPGHSGHGPGDGGSRPASSSDAAASAGESTVRLPGPTPARSNT